MGLAATIWNKRVVGFFIALSIFTYHSMTYGHLMPIFEDQRSLTVSLASAGLASISNKFSGGLGLSLRQVGMVMAVNGAIALFVQAVIFPLAAERVGVYKLFLIVTVLHPIAYAVVPLLLLVPESRLSHHIRLSRDPQHTVHHPLSSAPHPHQGIYPFVERAGQSQRIGCRRRRRVPHGGAPYRGISLHVRQQDQPHRIGLVQQHCRCHRRRRAVLLCSTRTQQVRRSSPHRS